MEVKIQFSDADLGMIESVRENYADEDRKFLDKVCRSKLCVVDDLLLLKKLLRQSRADFHLHELLQRSDVQLPVLEVPKRNPELDARLERIKASLLDEEYRSMVRNVDVRTARDSSVNEFGREFRSINRHLMTLVNMLFTVIGAFFFAYMATQYVFTGSTAFTARIVCGLLAATVVFFADLYFVIRTIDYTDGEQPPTTK